MSNTYIEKCMKLTQTVLFGGNIKESYIETRIDIYSNQKLKVPRLYLLTPTVLPKLFFELIISATGRFTAFKKLYHQYPIKIMSDSLIVNLIL